VCVSADVAEPRVLRDWSTVGSTSVSVVWRCNSNVRSVDAFLLYFRPLHSYEKRRRMPSSLDPTQLATRTDADLCAAGFSRIRVHRFVPKRSQAVLRDLTPSTDYVLILFAVNELGRSPPSVVFFQTAPLDEGVNKRTVLRRRPVERSICECLAAFAARVIRLTLNILLFSYVIMSALLIVVYHDTLYADLCHILDTTEFSEIICPVSRHEASGAALDKPQDSSLFTWLYNMFSNYSVLYIE